MKNYQVICHMLTSIDGRVTGRYLDREECQPFVQDYYRILDEFQTNNWICGRTTFEEIIGHTVLDLKEFEGQEVERVDYIANSQASSLAIALDPSGKANLATEYDWRRLCGAE